MTVMSRVEGVLIGRDRPNFQGGFPGRGDGMKWTEYDDADHTIMKSSLFQSTVHLFPSKYGG